jgi:hypothetical protein
MNPKGSPVHLRLTPDERLRQKQEAVGDSPIETAETASMASTSCVMPALITLVTAAASFGMTALGTTADTVSTLTTIYNSANNMQNNFDISPILHEFVNGQGSPTARLGNGRVMMGVGGKECLWNCGR